MKVGRLLEVQWGFTCGTCSTLPELVTPQNDKPNVSTCSKTAVTCSSLAPEHSAADWADELLTWDYNRQRWFLQCVVDHATHLKQRDPHASPRPVEDYFEQAARACMADLAHLESQYSQNSQNPTEVTQ